MKHDIHGRNERKLRIFQLMINVNITNDKRYLLINEVELQLYLNLNLNNIQAWNNK